MNAATFSGYRDAAVLPILKNRALELLDGQH